MYATSARKQVIGFTNIVFYIRETLDVADYEGATYVNLLGEASADRPCRKSIDITSPFCQAPPYQSIPSRPVLSPCRSIFTPIRSSIEA